MRISDKVDNISQWQTEQSAATQPNTKVAEQPHENQVINQGNDNRAAVRNSDSSLGANLLRNQLQGLDSSSAASKVEDSCRPQRSLPVNGSGTGQETGGGTAVGQFTITIGHEHYTGKLQQTVTSVTPQPDGSLAVTGTHVLELYKHGHKVGTINTQDTGVLTPSPDGTAVIKETLTPVSGTGKFKNVSGQITATANENLSTGASQFTISGSLSVKHGRH